MRGFVSQLTFYIRTWTGLRMLIGAFHLLFLLNTPSVIAEMVDNVSHHEIQTPLRVVVQDQKPVGFFYEGELIGIFVELFQKIGLSQNIDMDIKLAPIPRALQMMQNATSDITITYDFIAASADNSGAVYLPFTKDLHISLYALENNEIEIHHPDDLKGVSVGSGRILVPKQDKALLALGAKIQHFKTGIHQFKALKAGRIDLIATLDDFVSFNEKAIGVRLKKVYQLDEVLGAMSSMTLMFWFNGATLGSGAEEYCQRFKQGLIDLKKSGGINRILIEKYHYSSGDSMVLSGSSRNPFTCFNQKDLVKH